MARTAIGQPLHCPSVPACMHKLSSHHGLQSRQGHQLPHTLLNPQERPSKPHVLPLDASHAGHPSCTLFAAAHAAKHSKKWCHLGCRPQSSGLPKPPHPHTSGLGP